MSCALPQHKLFENSGAHPLGCLSPLLQNFVAPMVFGKRLNLHPVVVLFALVFWYMMWGIPGAFLSVPIMSVLKILCLNMDNMTAQWFARLLGALPAECLQSSLYGSCDSTEKFACTQKVMWKSTGRADQRVLWVNICVQPAKSCKRARNRACASDTRHSQLGFCPEEQEIAPHPCRCSLGSRSCAGCAIRGTRCICRWATMTTTGYDACSYRIVPCQAHDCSSPDTYEANEW